MARFLKASPDRFLKSLVYLAGKELVLAVGRGDHDVNETKLARALGLGEVFLARPADVEKATGAAVGFAGPVGFPGRVLIDPDAAAGRLEGPIPLPAPEEGALDVRVRLLTQRVADVLAEGIARNPQDWHMLQRLWIDSPVTSSTVL